MLQSINKKGVRFEKAKFWLIIRKWDVYNKNYLHHCISGKNSIISICQNITKIRGGSKMQLNGSFWLKLAIYQLFISWVPISRADSWTSSVTLKRSLGADSVTSQHAKSNDRKFKLLVAVKKSRFLFTFSNVFAHHNNNKSSIL